MYQLTFVEYLYAVLIFVNNILNGHYVWAIIIWSHMIDLCSRGKIFRVCHCPHMTLKFQTFQYRYSGTPVFCRDIILFICTGRLLFLCLTLSQKESHLQNASHVTVLTPLTIIHLLMECADFTRCPLYRTFLNQKWFSISWKQSSTLCMLLWRACDCLKH